MDTPEDAEREEGWLSLVEEISTDAISEFTFDKLRSYYKHNPNLAVNAIRSYMEAKSLIDISPSAALVLFTSSIEVGLKATILKPVVYGLVHNKSAADLISDLAIKHNGYDRIKELLATVLGDYGNINLNEFKIENHTKNAWQEIIDVQAARNAVVHRSELATREMAELSQELATMILAGYLPRILENLGLTLKEGGVIGNA